MFKIKKYENCIIVGAGEAGKIVLRELKNNPHSLAKVVGFVDDDPQKRNQTVDGVRVLGDRSDIPDIVQAKNIVSIIVAIPSASGNDIRSILGYCQIPDVRVKIVPGLLKILTDEVDVKVRDVKPEDLLGRETVKIDEAAVANVIKGKRVLVTGGAGSIGTEICRQVALFGARELLILDHNENDMYFLDIELRDEFCGLRIVPVIGDITDTHMLQHLFSSYRPEIVFHAAAFKHVPLMEKNIVGVVRNNIIGTRNVLDTAEKYDVERFVFISTDKAVNPSSVMGASKRIGEMLVQAKSQKNKMKCMAVRFGNVLGSKGSVVPLFKKQIEAGGPVTVTHPDVRRYFMNIKEAVMLVLQASALGQGGEIFILDMGEQIKIADLARELIVLSGFCPGDDIPIEFIGLRPGEKLYEEILLNYEMDTATRHDKIFVTQPELFNVRTLVRDIKVLERLSRLYNAKDLLGKLKDIVPFCCVDNV